MSKISTSLVLGQLLSLSLASCSFTTSLLTRNGVKAPITQVTLAYFLIAVVYGSAQLYRRQNLQLAWYWYLLLAVVASQGSYLVTKAYQYTSITSVMLLDCFTIPWVVFLTWFVLGTRYTLWQLFGAVICVLGIGFVILSDTEPDAGGGSKPLLGDFLVLFGTVLIGLTNVGEEYCVKKRDWIETLSMLGLFGFFVSAIELSVLEVKTLENVKWSWNIILIFAAYAFSIFMFHTLSAIVLKMSGSTMFNLSLLTSDMWVVAIRIFLYHQKVNWLYFLAFLVVAVGLIIYSSKGNETESASSLAEENVHLIPDDP